MQHQQQQQPARPKLEDSKRIQLVLDEINAKYADRKNGNQRIFMDEKAKQMFLDYANELTISVLEASNMLAQHRNSKTIEIADVNMVLGKKLGIEIPRFANVKQEHNADGGNDGNAAGTTG